MKLNDIKNSVIKKLYTGGFKVYGENVLEMEQNEPYIVVMLEPLTQLDYCCAVHTEKNVLCDISYLAGSDPTREQMYNAMDEIKSCIGSAIAVGNRNLTLKNVSYNITDQIAHVMFNLVFSALLVLDEGAENMSELSIGGTN